MPKKKLPMDNVSLLFMTNWSERKWPEFLDAQKEEELQAVVLDFLAQGYHYALAKWDVQQSNRHEIAEAVVNGIAKSKTHSISDLKRVLGVSGLRENIQ